MGVKSKGGLRIPGSSILNRGERFSSDEGRSAIT